MSTTWDVRTPSGKPVGTLTELAGALAMNAKSAAAFLLADDALAAAAPGPLVEEAKAKAKGDETPPSISNGNFVSWANGKGRVDLIVTRGKVPGVDGDVEGTEKSPAARVVVWKDGKPTREKIAASTHTLRRIAPLNETPSKKSDPAQALVALHTRHQANIEAYNLPGFRRVGPDAVKTAFERGVQSWPGPDRTSLSAEQWGLGRAEHLVKVAAGEVESKSAAGHDLDLLHAEHPFYDGGEAKAADTEAVVVEQADVAATIAALREVVTED